MQFHEFMSLFCKNNEVLNLYQKNISKLEKIFSCTLPFEIYIILANKDKFIDVNSNTSLRILDINEIINAQQELHIDFIKLGLIPLIDIFDNNFFVFSISSSSYKIFNLNDEAIFEDYKSIYDFLLSYNKK